MILILIPENFFVKGRYLESPKFFQFLANCQWKFLTALGLPAAAKWANCPLHQATVIVKVSFGFSILLVFINFLRFSEYFSVI